MRSICLFQWYILRHEIRHVPYRVYKNLPFLHFPREMLMDWQAFWLTTRLAILVAATLVMVGLPIAYWIAYSRWRWKFLVEAVVALPIVLPPTVLGFYVLVAIG